MKQIKRPGLVQPIAGNFSDFNKSKFGRRKPYILTGLILTVIGYFIFGNSIIFGKWLGDTDKVKKYAIAISVSSLWVLNIGL